MNITETWLRLYPRPTDALNDINEVLGTKYNTGNLTQWKQGKKGLTSQAYNFMLKAVLAKGEIVGYQGLRMPDPKNPNK